jgi:hypothetical protein
VLRERRLGHVAHHDQGEPLAAQRLPQSGTQPLAPSEPGAVEAQDRQRVPHPAPPPSLLPRAPDGAAQPALGGCAHRGPPEYDARLVALEVRHRAGQRADIGTGLDGRGRNRDQHAAAAELLEVEVLLAVELHRLTQPERPRHGARP